MLGYSFNLRHAVEKAKARNRKVWAEDYNQGKRFLVALNREIYQYCTIQEQPSVYEVVFDENPCALYMDIDVDVREIQITTDTLKELFPTYELYDKHDNIVNEYLTTMNSEIDEEEPGLATRIIRKSLYLHLRLSLGVTIDAESIKIFSACRTSKLSFHVLCRDVIFTENSISCAAYVYEFSKYFQHKCFEIYYDLLTKGIFNPLRRCLCRLLGIHRSSIDMSVYSRVRQFRLLGNAKRGKSPLISSSPTVGYDPEWTFRNIVPTLDEFQSSLIFSRDMIELNQLFVQPASILKTARKRFLEKYQRAVADDYIAEYRYVATGKSAPERSETDITRFFQPRDIQNSKIADDDENIYGEDMVGRPFRTYEEGDVVYDPHCEVINNRPSGSPSACIIKSYDENNGLYCFNCNTLTWSLSTWDPQFLSESAKPNELLNNSIKKINLGKHVDINLDEGPKYCFVDAPPDTGKTELVKSYITKHQRKSVLCISFRISLTNYLANRLNIRSYQVEGIWKECYEERERIAVCIDSLIHIPIIDRYDIIVLDEAGLTRLHTTSTTMTGRVQQVYQQLERLLIQSEKVILLQHQLTQRDVQFYTSFEGIDADDEQYVRRWILARPLTLMPMRYSTHLSEVVAGMISFYRANYDYEREIMRTPFVVFCNSITLCQILHVVLRSYSSSTIAKSRIRGIWSTNQKYKWQKNFLNDPNLFASEADILLVTSVIQAGHSFDHYFVTGFDILCRGILTHRQELQFTSRLRVSTRSDLHTCRYAYIQKSKSNSQLVLRKKIEHDLSKIGASAPSDYLALYYSTCADIASERADTFNRHLWLWKKTYKENMIKFEPGLEISNTISEQQAKSDLSQATKTVSKSIRKYMIDIEDDDMEDRLFEILDDEQYLDIIEVVKCEIGETKKKLKEYIVGDFKDGCRTLLALNISIESSKLYSHLIPYYLFASFVDYSIREHTSHWNNRERFCNQYNTTAKRNISMVQMLWDILIKFDCSDLTTMEINDEIDSPKLYSILKPHESTVNLVLKQSLVKYLKTTTTSRMMRTLLRKVNLNLVSTKKRKIVGSSTIYRIEGVAKNFLCLSVILDEDHNNAFMTHCKFFDWSKIEDLIKKLAPYHWSN